MKRAPTSPGTGQPRRTSVGECIRGAIARLAMHPEMGRAGRIAGTRELVIPRLPYVAAYRISDGVVDALTIFHAARRWPSAF